MLDAERLSSAVWPRSWALVLPEIGPGLVAVDAATLGLAVAERPGAAPGRTLRPGEGRGGVAVGAEPCRVPVGGCLVRQRGDGVLDAGREAARVLALTGAQRRAERDTRAR